MATIFKFSLLVSFYWFFLIPSFVHAEAMSTKVLDNLADPDVYYHQGSGEYFLTGTRGRVVPIYKSRDGLSFSLFKTINPSNLDSQFNYCYVWAPDIHKRSNGRFRVTFSASRYSKGKNCSGIHDVTTYYIDFPNKNFDNPSTVRLFKLGAAESFAARGCRSVGCERTVRIDADQFYDPVEREEHFFYTWFQAGNNISSVSYSTPNWVTQRARPSVNSDESINEAPDVFKRGEYYYMLFSNGHFQNSYGLRYYMSQSTDDLGRGRRLILRQPHLVSNSSRCAGYSGKSVREAGGHSSTIRVGDRYYIYYHINRYRYDSKGCHLLTGRDTWRSPIDFMPNGTIRPLKMKKVSWNSLGESYVYSLDIRTKNGQYVSACRDAGDLKNDLALLLSGNCKNGTSLSPGNIRELRICASDNGWQSASCSPFRGIFHSDTQLTIPTRRRHVRWNKIDSKHIYSIDVRLKDGRTLAPCNPSGEVGPSDHFVLDGQCYNRSYNLSDVDKVRVCATDNGWRSATCSAYKSTGSNPFVNLWFEKHH